MKNHKHEVTSNLLLQQGFKPGLAERLNAWLASAENAESLQEQVQCCANTSSDQDFTTLCPPPHFPPPPSSGSPRSPPTTPTTFPPATSCPSSPPEPSCPPATPSCLSVLASRYNNLLVALLGDYIQSQEVAEIRSFHSAGIQYKLFQELTDMPKQPFSFDSPEATCPARAQSARARRDCALRALGLLLADGAPTVGRGKTFWRVNRIFLRKQL